MSNAETIAAATRYGYNDALDDLEEYMRFITDQQEQLLVKKAVQHLLKNTDKRFRS